MKILRREDPKTVGVNNMYWTDWLRVIGVNTFWTEWSDRVSNMYWIEWPDCAVLITCTVLNG